MRYLGRTFLLLLLVGLGGWGWHLFGHSSLPSPSSAPSPYLHKVDEARRSITYLLKQDAWITVSLPAGRDVLKVITNASISADVAVPPDETWEYSIDYELLDPQGQVVKTQTYHHRTRLVQYNDPKTGEILTSAFYLQATLTVTEGKIMLINLYGLEQATMIRFRLARQDTALIDVGLRTYIPEAVAEHKLGYLWQRLSVEHKAALAKGSVYPVDFLREDEKRQLLQRHWQPLGPQGIEGRDYQTRNLYVLQEIDGEQVQAPVLPAGLFIAAAHHGSIPLPEAGGTVRLEFLDVDPQTPHHGTVTLRWYGPGATKRATYTVKWQGHNTRFERFIAGGLLDITAPQALVVRAFLRRHGQSTEVTPEPMYVRAYSVSPGLPVDFEVIHLERQATPFRIDVRRLRSSTTVAAPAASAPLLYQLLDAQHKVVKSGQLSIEPTLSLYDSLSARPPDLQVTETMTWYFSLPAPITRIRFLAPASGPHEVFLIAAYNRSPDVLWSIRVPEDFYQGETEEERQRAWFAKLPEEEERLLQDNRTVLLTVQPRPPKENPEILAGRYLWEDYHPQGAWLARHLLLRRDDHAPFREEALPVTYRPLLPGDTTTLHVRAPHGMEQAQPQLLFFRKQASPLTLRLVVDGELYDEEQISGTRGELQLPPLSPGIHRFHFASAGQGTFLLNHLDPGPDAWVKRLANRFDSKGLSFIYEKSAQQDVVLSVRFHVPYGTSSRSRILVRLEGPADVVLGPLASWTITSRRYDIRPSQDAPAPVLNTAADYVDQGQPFFIPLGGNLPPGRYRIHFRLEQGTPGYLTLAKLTPGVFPQRAVFRETPGPQPTRTSQKASRHVVITTE